jgi:hypothetical protein
MSGDARQIDYDHRRLSYFVRASRDHPVAEIRARGKDRQVLREPRAQRTVPP